ncbi:MAG TPA: DNA-binding protein YbiB, partial [Usitatibacter sp.]|nr:DNA-binding protein YbiB [Usitatibacter sp.]
MAFDPRPYLKELARGEHGARSLDREQARALFAAVFAGEVADVALGALLVALRIKGETPAELAGMLDALAPHVQPLRLPSRRAMPVLVPTYNGARKLPNLVPLLALSLAREGVPVLLHGAAQEAQRVDTFAILSLLGHAPVASMAEAEARLDERLLAPLPLAVLSPALARLVDVRLAIGVRNSGHTLAKLLLPREVPSTAACRLISVTHPDFMKRLRDMFAGTPANVFLMRGVEGEPVVRLHSPQPVEQVGVDGSVVTHLMADGEQDLHLPAREAPATAEWTRDVLEARAPRPSALARQVSLIVEHCRAAGAAARP